MQRTGILILAIVLMNTTAYASTSVADAMLCLKQVKITLKHSDSGPIIIKGVDDQIKRRYDMNLKIASDCQSGKPLVPGNSDQALEWLDLALPLDFKGGMTGGDYINPYAYTTYSGDADLDLNAYFEGIWKLSADGPACKGLPRNKYMRVGENWCFYRLLDALRERYKSPKALLPWLQQGFYPDFTDTGIWGSGL